MFWNNKCVGYAALIGVAFACASSARGETVRVLTEEFPPYNYTENGKITGFSTEVVRAALQAARLPGWTESSSRCHGHAPTKPRRRATAS